MIATEDREWLEELLPKTAHKHIDKILDYFSDDRAALVEVCGARVQVEQVEAYGLTIGLDAIGNASTVRFSYGADVLEVLP